MSSCLVMTDLGLRPLALQPCRSPTWQVPESVGLRITLAFCFLLMASSQNSQIALCLRLSPWLLLFQVLALRHHLSCFFFSGNNLQLSISVFLCTTSPRRSCPPKQRGLRFFFLDTQNFRAEKRPRVQLYKQSLQSCIRFSTELCNQSVQSLYLILNILNCVLSVFFPMPLLYFHKELIK